MNDVRKMGRVTIPTDTDAVSETLDLLKRWGADAIRDCDGTEFPQELKDTGAKIYATYYTTRKDNAWAKANPDETQQCYIMTPFYTAEGGALTIPLMTGISRELMKVNDHDDIARWWEVMDRTTGEPVPTADWHYDAARESVVIDPPAAYHECTVSCFGCSGAGCGRGVSPCSASRTSISSWPSRRSAFISISSGISFCSYSAYTTSRSFPYHASLPSRQLSSAVCSSTSIFTCSPARSVFSMFSASFPPLLRAAQPYQKGACQRMTHCGRIENERKTNGCHYDSSHFCIHSICLQ